MNKILIVDDEPDAASQLVALLGNIHPDWAIWFTVSASDAIQRIENSPNGGEFDLVVTDWKFDRENLSGTDVIKAARIRDPLCMVIAMTAYQGDAMNRYDDALIPGAYDVIDKASPDVILHKEISLKGRMALSLRASCQLRASFSRHIDSKVVDSYADKRLVDFNSRPLTVMFTDIRGFSKVNNHLIANNAIVADFLKGMYETIINVCHRWGGMVDKFMGDGAMILFGAPALINATAAQQSHNACNAVAAALDLQKSIQPVIAEFRNAFENLVSVEWEGLDLGIGIHCADVLVGLIETSARDQFTAVGHGVNLAKRFESASGRVRSDGSGRLGNILISQTVRTKVKDKFILKDEGVLDGLRNIDGKQLVWSVIDFISAESAIPV